MYIKTVELTRHCVKDTPFGIGNNIALSANEYIHFRGQCVNGP